LGFFGPNVRKNNIWEVFLPHLQYHQIWLNMLMDDGYLSNITKLKKNSPRGRWGEKKKVATIHKKM
jgi:hypothetical protein